MRYKKKFFIITIPYFLIIIILSIFLLLPSITDIRDISDEIKGIKQNLLLRQIKGQNVQKNIDELKRVKKSANSSSVFVEKEDKLGFIKNLELIAKEHYIKQDIKINIQGEGDEEKLKIAINSEGKFIDLVKYLHSLETQKYCFNIESLIWNSNIAKTDNNIKNMKLSIKAYVCLK